MTLSLTTQREAKRWYKLIPHETQLSLINDDVRFKVIPAGRRSGKTCRFKRYVVKQAMKNPGMPYFAAAPTRDQAKRIFWNDLKLLSFSSLHERRPSETELSIYLNNGSTISVLGLDKPERIEGVFWAGGGIDEFGDLKESAWGEHISPALDTFNPTMPEYKAWCWLFGVPEGLNHYYDRYQYAINSGDTDWKGYLWPSSDILPEATIEAAKRQLSLRQFRQEYEACHLPTTEIALFDGGMKKIKDVVPGDELVHVDSAKKKIKCTVKNCGKTLQKRIFMVTLENGEKVFSSDNHCYKV